MRLVVTDRDADGHFSLMREVDTGPYALEDLPFESGIAARLLAVRIARTVDDVLEGRGKRRRSKSTTKPLHLGPPPTRPLYDAYPDRRDPNERRRISRRGQTLVEVAITLPLLLFIGLGFTEVALLFAAQHRYQNGIDVLAQLAAADTNESWHSKVREENDRTGCDGGEPEFILPDGGREPGMRVRLVWHCRYRAAFVSTLSVPVTVESEAVVRDDRAEPSPSSG